MTEIIIPKGEQGVIRVFAVSRPVADITQTLKQHSKAYLASMLLAQDVTPPDIELFALSDLAGVGLPRYLLDGYDVDADSVQADRARLEALDGFVLLLFSRVSDTGEITLRPTPDLTLIGTYAEPAIRRAAAPLTADSARPFSGVTQAPEPVGRSRVGSALTGACVLLILLTLWWILS